MVELARCVGKCNTFDDLSDKVRVRNKTADLNPSFFSMITGINESKTLTKPISSKCKCRLDEIKCHSDQWWNNNKCTCECKKHHVFERDYICNTSSSSFKNGKYFGSIMDHSAIMCNEVIVFYYKEINTFPTNFYRKKAIYKIQNFYIFLALLLITIASLIAVSIYCYLIKYRTIQKYLLLFHVNLLSLHANNKLKEILY